MILTSICIVDNRRIAGHVVGVHSIGGTRVAGVILTHMSLLRTFNVRVLDKISMLVIVAHVCLVGLGRVSWHVVLRHVIVDISTVSRRRYPRSSINGSHTASQSFSVHKDHGHDGYDECNTEKSKESPSSAAAPSIT